MNLKKLFLQLPQEIVRISENDLNNFHEAISVSDLSNSTLIVN